MILFTKFFRKKENKYDHIISLGYNCEVTFRFLKYFKFEESNLFNWTATRTIDDLINALANFDKIGTNDFNTPNPLWECKNTKIRFHGKAPMSIYINKTATTEEMEADKKELTERIKYLKNKFLNILCDNSKKMYVCKIKSENINENINFKIETIIKKLKILGGKNFDLLVISEDRMKNFFIPQNYIYRTVKYFAPDNDVTSKKYFNNGWNKIFDEFYQPKIKSKKKKYKFGEI